LTLLAAVTLAALVGSCGWFESEDTPITLPPGDEVDIPYGPARPCPDSPNPCGSQLLDIYRSDEPGPNPVLLWFHGGGFVLGDKGGLTGDLQPILDAGWDIVAVGYRLALPDGTNAFPAAAQDANLAVRWVRANAEAQDWDPDRIAALGHSAGGNLVGLLATTAGDPRFEAPAPEGFEELNGVDASILAGIAMAPVSDLESFAGVDEGSLEVVSQYLNCDGECWDLLAAGSVQNHVDERSAPLLALHGIDDVLAAPEQGELVQLAYEANGIGDRFELIVVDDGPEEFRGHNLDVSRWVQRFIDFLESAEPV
jgi:acetyl esterase/lipase